MTSFADRLSRISALRPVRAADAPRERSQNSSSQLLQLLDAERVRNCYGSHTRLRIGKLKPEAGELCPGALRLLAPADLEAITDPARWLFLDTETTGLSGGTGTYAFLVGLAWWQKDGLAVEQHFMQDHSEEPSLLQEIVERLGGGRVLVTFNGKSFDWPLLKTRFQMARIQNPPVPAAHLDLLYPARQLWRLSLRSVALTQLEQHVLGFDRGPDIPSETIPQRYFDYLRGGPPEPVAEIFRHNQMDLCGLAALALRINEILKDPEGSGCCAGELFGISRILQKNGDPDLAGRIYEKALGSGLPRAAEQIAQRELALLAKRRRDYELSNSLWEKLLDDTALGLRAYEQLAIYYEHHANLPGKAAELSREALIKLQSAFQRGRIAPAAYQELHARFHHRLRRLSPRIQGPGSRFPVPSY